jgi:hypothetical protein
LSDEQLKTEIDDQAAADENNPSLEPKPLGAGEIAKSLVCDVCGKKFRSQAQAEFHAEKTDHDQFSESTEEIAPLTEEEKKARLAELKANVAEKRAKQALIDKEEQKKNEVNPSHIMNLNMARLITHSTENPTKGHQRSPRSQRRPRQT